MTPRRSWKNRKSTLASDQGELIETDAAMKELYSEKTKTMSQFVADNENKLADAARKADEASQTLAKAAARLSRTKLYAPIDGVVQQMAVTTVGQVVTTGQQLIVVTPSEGALQVEALVANLDIGFVKLGQEAAVKVDAFPVHQVRRRAWQGRADRLRGGRRAASQARPSPTPRPRPTPPAPRRRARRDSPKASSFP